MPEALADALISVIGQAYSDATDNERLDGSNGFLVSPHIDHLFDQGYLTFPPGQRLLEVPEVHDRLVDAWGSALRRSHSSSGVLALRRPTF